MITDGATEAQSERGEFFEAEGVLRVVGRERRHGSAHIIRELRRAIEDFTAGSPQRDDITVVIGKANG
jgi:serine phosphatase RsbU (regulator of sigma subunit)